MARPIDEFVVAWDALSGKITGEGWRSIRVSPAGPCILMAGRRFPGNEEALLAGFSMARVPVAENLPEGRGFGVFRADPHGDNKTWIALTRKESGSLELFAAMVGDIAGAMDAEAESGEERILQVMLSRVKAWQEFMSKGAQSLGPEAELGLFGELSFLKTLIDLGVPFATAVESWVGPLEAPQDFTLGGGAIEVKATLAAVSFPAKIGSLQQLDDSVLSPLFIAGLRFSRMDSGASLPEFAAAIRNVLKLDMGAEQLFNDRLMSAGYFDAHADRYIRRFVPERMRIMHVGEKFPRIVASNVPIGVLRVIYEIDLDQVKEVDAGLSGVLKELGVL